MNRSTTAAVACTGLLLALATASVPVVTLELSSKIGPCGASRDRLWVWQVHRSPRVVKDYGDEQILEQHLPRVEWYALQIALVASTGGLLALGLHVRHRRRAAGG